MSPVLDLGGGQANAQERLVRASGNKKGRAARTPFFIQVNRGLGSSAHYRFDFEEFLKAVLAPFAAIAGLLIPAKWR